MNIPLLGTPDSPLSATTQAIIPIADVVDDLVMYKDGGVAMVLESTSLNFGLLSSGERAAVIAGFSGLLNSLGFSIQICVRSQRKDIGSYLKLLDEAETKISNPKLEYLMRDYKKYIKNTVKKKNVLSKRFFFVVLFSRYELGLAKSFASSLMRKEDMTVPYPKNYVLRKAKIALYPKRDHIQRQSGRFGVVVRQLNNQELLELFYKIYNPSKPIKDTKVFE